MSLMAGLLATSIGTNLGTSLLNFYEQEKALRYSKGLQQDIFTREDNSVQRRVSDLQAAGLSPVLAAGQGAGTGGVVSVNAPQMSGLSDAAVQAMSLLTSEANLGKTAAEKELLQMQTKKALSEKIATDIRAQMDQYDLDRARYFGTRVHPTGITGTATDIFGMLKGTLLKQSNKVGKTKEEVDAYRKAHPEVKYMGNSRGFVGDKAPTMWYEDNK